MTSNLHANKQVPADFPRSCGGSVSGVQNKLSARKIGGRFVGDGMTKEELWVRYEACWDLAMKLAEHAMWKRGQYADLSLQEFLRRLRAGVVKKRWDLAPEELNWVMGRVAVAMGGSPDDALGEAPFTAIPMPGGSDSAHARVETIVDRARASIQRHGS